MDILTEIVNILFGAESIYLFRQACEITLVMGVPVAVSMMLLYEIDGHI